MSDVIAFADAAISWLNELPDRTSPDDWPEACLVTGDELHGYLVEQLQEFLTSDRAATEARVRQECIKAAENALVLCNICPDWTRKEVRDDAVECTRAAIIAAIAAIRAGDKT